MLIKSLCLILLVSVGVFASQTEPQVRIEQGSLKGKILQTQHGRSFSSFTSIPYAKPPVGALRFEAPIPATSWDGVLDATKPHTVCPQMNTFFKDFTVVGNEDCLYLNVYTPKLPTSGDKLLPVMFFIHGGGWFVGTGAKEMYGPEYLLDKDIVLVTINYRLGPLGFFSTGDATVPGNNGLKDQALALKWVKKNIAQFGGDSDSITIFGESAGGASVHLHMYSPLSKDLFKRAIAQSGTSFCTLSLVPMDILVNRSKTLAEHVNCPVTSSDTMINCLRKADSHDIIKQIKTFLITDIDPMTLFKPVIEPIVDGAFLPEDPLDIILSGKAAKVPFMNGVNADDGAFRSAGIFDAPVVIKNLNDDFKKYGPVVLAIEEIINSNAKDEISTQIKKFYFGDKPIGDSTKKMFTKMYTDVIFIWPAEMSVKLHTKYLGQTVYYYLFDYAGSVSYCNGYFGNGTSGEKVVCHADDLLYLLPNNLMLPNYKPTAEDQKVTELMLKLWTNFAIYGNPTPETDSTIPEKWEPIQQGKNNYYTIKSASDVKMNENLLQERARFWINLPLNARHIKIRDSL